MLAVTPRCQHGAMTDPEVLEQLATLLAADVAAAGGEAKSELGLARVGRCRVDAIESHIDTRLGLIPVCSRHHQTGHEVGRTPGFGAERSPTMTQPDVTESAVSRPGVPSRHATDRARRRRPAAQCAPPTQLRHHRCVRSPS